MEASATLGGVRGREVDGSNRWRGVKLNQDAFLKQAAEFHPRLAAHVRGKIGRRHRTLLEPDDVLQVTYIEALYRLDQFVPDDSRSFERWLEKIAATNIVDAIRGFERQKRSPAGKRVMGIGGLDAYSTLWFELADSGTSPSQSVARDEAKHLLERALEQLPPDYARAIRLYDIEQRAIQDVANTIQRGAGAVHMLRARGHARLREILGHSGRFFTDGSTAPIRGSVEQAG